MSALPTPLPSTPYLRRGDVIRWLESLGIDRKAFEKLAQAKVVERVLLPGCRKGFFLRNEIDRVIVKPFRDAEARVAAKLGK